MLRSMTILSSAMCVLAVSAHAQDRSLPFANAHVAFVYRAGEWTAHAWAGQTSPSIVQGEIRTKHGITHQFAVDIPWLPRSPASLLTYHEGQVAAVRKQPKKGFPLPGLSVRLAPPSPQVVRDVAPEQLRWFINLDLLTPQEREHVLALIHKKPAKLQRPDVTKSTPKTTSPSRSRRRPR